MKTSPNAVVHPLTSADAQARILLRSVLAPHKGQVRGVAARPAFDAILRQTPPAKNVEYVPDTTPINRMMIIARESRLLAGFTEEEIQRLVESARRSIAY